MEDDYFEATRLAILETLAGDVIAQRLTSAEAIEVLSNALADLVAAISDPGERQHTLDIVLASLPSRMAESAASTEAKDAAKH